MSSEPPASGDAQEEGPATESPSDDVDRSSSDGGRARWKSSIVIAVGVLAVAGGIGVFLFLNQKSDSRPENVAPARGLACRYLQQAAVANERGNIAAYNQAISRAADVAEKTLRESGEVFGEPERIALELELAPKENPDHVERLLEGASQKCQDLHVP